MLIWNPHPGRGAQIREVATSPDSLAALCMVPAQAFRGGFVGGKIASCNCIGVQGGCTASLHDEPDFSRSPRVCAIRDGCVGDGAIKYLSDRWLCGLFRARSREDFLVGRAVLSRGIRAAMGCVAMNHNTKNASKIKTLGAALIAVCTLQTTAVVAAETITHRVEVPMSSSNWKADLQIPQFDGAIGTLTGVEVRMSGVGCAVTHLENRGNLARDFVTGSDTTLQLLGRDGR